MVVYCLQVVYSDWEGKTLIDWYFEDASDGILLYHVKEPEYKVYGTEYKSKTAAIKAIRDVKYFASCNQHIYRRGKINVISFDGNRTKIEKSVYFHFMTI